MTYGKFYYCYVCISLCTKTHKKKNNRKKAEVKLSYSNLLARIIENFKICSNDGPYGEKLLLARLKLEVLRCLFSLMLHSLYRSLPAVLQVSSSFFIFEWSYLYYCTPRLQNLWSYMSHNLSERRNNFVFRYLKLSHVVAVLQLAWCALSRIWFG